MNSTSTQFDERAEFVNALEQSSIHFLHLAHEVKELESLSTAELRKLRGRLREERDVITDLIREVDTLAKHR